MPALNLRLSFYVQNHYQRLVNLGCGARFHPDWTNIDLVSCAPQVRAHDLSRGIPLPDASCDAVYHSHVLEHIRRDEVPAFLAECRRILKPGGVLRVVVPDLEQICRLYLQRLEAALKGDAAAQVDYDWLMLEMYDQVVRENGRGAMWQFVHSQEMINRDFVESRIGRLPQKVKMSRWKEWFWDTAHANARRFEWCKPFRALRIGYFRLRGETHQWMYDRFSLARLLLRAGFENPVQQSAKSSLIPEWSKYNLDTWPDGSVYKPDSLFMETVNPR